MADGVTKAAADCPDSAILVGGYSQGAALVHRAVEDLPANVMSRIAGAITFGDTQNQQDNEQIPNFPPEKTLIICNAGDAVCRGTLTILPAHLAYTARADEAVDFLTQMVGNTQSNTATPAKKAAGATKSAAAAVKNAAGKTKSKVTRRRQEAAH